MKANKKLIALLVISALQLAAVVAIVPWGVLLSRETWTVRLEVVVRDPIHPLKGRYVELDFAEELKPVADLPSMESFGPDELRALVGKDLHCVVSPSADPDDISGLTDLRVIAPESGELFFSGATVVDIRERDDGVAGIALAFPFERYYLEENLAPRAESLIRSWGEERKRIVLVLSILKDGTYLAKALEVDGVPIEKYLKDTP